MIKKKNEEERREIKRFKGKKLIHAIVGVPKSTKFIPKLLRLP